MQGKSISWIVFQNGLLAAYWHDVFRHHGLDAELMTIHNGFDAITGRGPYPSTFEIRIPVSEVEAAMQLMDYLLDWPEIGDPIYECSSIGLAFMAVSPAYDRISQALARKLFKRLYGKLPDFIPEHFRED